MTFSLVNVDPKEIKHDPDTPNVRDRVKDTTDLQASIKAWGIQNPLEVRIVDDEFFLIGGHRRLTAAKALKLKTVPCIIKEVDPADVSVLMLISDMQKAFPHIISNDAGDVVGGRASAVASLLSGGKLKKYQIAKMIGVKADVVGAYVALVKDGLAVRRRVENGDMDITVYSLIKRQGEAFKDRLLKKKGRITANYVRRFKKGWPEIQKQEAVASDAPMEPSGSSIDDLPEVEYSMETEYSTAWCLNSAIDWLNKVRGREIEPTDRYLIDTISNIVAGYDG